MRRTSKKQHVERVKFRSRMAARQREMLSSGIVYGRSMGKSTIMTSLWDNFLKEHSEKKK